MPFQRAERAGAAPVPVRADLFPARITINGTIAHDPVKAIIGMDTIWLYSITGSDGTLVGSFPIDDIRRDRGSGYIVDSGNHTLGVTRSGHCGCGGNRSWKPFPYTISMTPLRRT